MSADGKHHFAFSFLKFICCRQGLSAWMVYLSCSEHINGALTSCLASYPSCSKSCIYWYVYSCLSGYVQYLLTYRTHKDVLWCYWNVFALLRNRRKVNAESFWLFCPHALIWRLQGYSESNNSSDVSGIITWPRNFDFEDTYKHAKQKTLFTSIAPLCWERVSELKMQTLLTMQNTWKNVFYFLTMPRRWRN